MLYVPGALREGFTGRMAGLLALGGGLSALGEALRARVRKARVPVSAEAAAPPRPGPAELPLAASRPDGSAQARLLGACTGRREPGKAQTRSLHERIIHAAHSEPQNLSWLVQEQGRRVRAALGALRATSEDWNLPAASRGASGAAARALEAYLWELQGSRFAGFEKRLDLRFGRLLLEESRLAAVRAGTGR